MALYRYSVQVISRSRGQSAVAAAAYRSGSKLHDQRLNLTHDYSRKSEVAWSEILAPSGAPDWVFDRQQLWNIVEQGEPRKDSQVAREVLLAVPIELSLAQAQGLVREFAQEQFVARGMVADGSLHWKDGNPHVHWLLTMRDLHETGFGWKNRAWNGKTVVQQQREAWADHCNRALTQAGVDEQVDHRSLQAQGIDRIPQIHLGTHAARALETGQFHPRVERYLAIAAANEQIAQWQQQAIALTHEIDQEVQQQTAWADRVLPIAASLFEQQATANLAMPQPDGTWRVQWGNYAIDLANDHDGIDECLRVSATKRGELGRAIAWADGRQQVVVSGNLTPADVAAFAQVAPALRQWQQQHWVEQVAPIAWSAIELAGEAELVGENLTLQYQSHAQRLTVQDAQAEPMLVAQWQGDRWIDQGSRLQVEDVRYFTEEVLPQVQALQHQQWVESQMHTALDFFRQQSKAKHTRRNTAGESIASWGNLEMAFGQDDTGNYFALRANGRGDIALLRPGQHAIETGQGLSTEDAQTINQIQRHLDGLNQKR